jgi:DNA modification methylase
MQTKQVEIHIIYTDAETEIMKALELKWNNHINLQNNMTDIIKDYGLNSDLFQQELSRKMFTGREEIKGAQFIAINNDTVAEHQTMPDNSVDMYVTSIPFGNHYEYSENYNCFGHNETNEKFFAQMDFLVPHLYRCLKPGRIAAIHVKDRIRYSYMNGTGFTSIEPFSDHTNQSFIKHGFHLIARITVTTDVVRENNQTYRLGWTEKCKDGTKMGTGLPEYVLIYRKAPTDSSNAYADVPVVHSKDEYTRARWQLDAHAFWKSNGETLFSTEHLRQLDLSDVLTAWKDIDARELYDYNRHVSLCERLDEIGKLPTSFMAVPPTSQNVDVWDDITRMNTLNTTQSQKCLTKHICPLQLDLIERLIERYSNKGELIVDPFGGIMSVPYQAVKMGRLGMGIELNTEYYLDGVKHLKSAEILNSQLQLI